MQNKETEKDFLFPPRVLATFLRFVDHSVCLSVRICIRRFIRKTMFSVSKYNSERVLFPALKRKLTRAVPPAPPPPPTPALLLSIIALFVALAMFCRFHTNCFFGLFYKIFKRFLSTEEVFHITYTTSKYLFA